MTQNEHSRQPKQAGLSYLLGEIIDLVLDLSSNNDKAKPT